MPGRPPHPPPASITDAPDDPFSEQMTPFDVHLHSKNAEETHSLLRNTAAKLTIIPCNHKSDTRSHAIIGAFIINSLPYLRLIKP